MNSQSNSMFIITVIPIARGISMESLSYLSIQHIPEGSLIEVPLRKKNIKALVLKTEDARAQKMAIKSSTFALKKINKVSTHAFLPSWSMNIVALLADYYASTPGSFLYALCNKLLFGEELETHIQISSDTKKSKPYAIEGDVSFRLKKYEEIIKRNIDQQTSTVILCPTLHSINKLQKALEKTAHKERLVVLHSKITKKKFQKTLERIKSGESLLIVTSGTFLFLLPSNISTLIIEEENSRWFKMRTRPYVDFYKVAERISSLLCLETIYGDILLRSETEMKTKEIVREKKKSITTTVICTKKPIASDAEKVSYEVLGPEIEEEMKTVLSEHGTVFIYVPRRGYSPIVICAHCGTRVSCHKCDAPIVLHKGKNNEENYFLCHHCGDKRSALEACEHCTSWKLQAYGVGIEKIEEEVEKKYKKYQSSITIGNDKTIGEAEQSFDLTLIPSIDSLFSLPDFNMDERLLYTILQLKEKTNEQLIIKTRFEKLPLLTYIKEKDSEKNLEEFHAEQCEKRKRFGYAPFKTLIKITVKGKKEQVAVHIDKMKEDLKKWKPTTFPAFIKTVNNQFIMHMLIKVDSLAWPESELLEYLRALPPSFEIQIDPESLL